MHALLPPRSTLAVALAFALVAALPAQAQQVVADGDDQTPAAGDYTTTDPVEPGNPAGYAFHAINGGSIVPAGEVNLRTEGLRAAAVRVDGMGSRVELEGGSITTVGAAAAGVSVVNDGHASLKGVRIETQGAESHGIAAAGGTVDAERVHIVVGGALSSGVLVSGGQVTLRDSTIETRAQNRALDVTSGSLEAERITLDHRSNGAAVQVGSAGEMTLRSAVINASAAGGSGITSQSGSRMTLENVDINLLHASAGTALQVAGDAVYRGGTITSASTGSSAITLYDGSALALHQVNVEGGRGIWLNPGASLVMRDSRVDSLTTGVNLNSLNSTADISGAVINARNGAGIEMWVNSQLQLTDSTVTATGADGYGVALFGSAQAAISGSDIRTTGERGLGLYANPGSGPSSALHFSGGTVLTEGAEAMGAVAYQGGSVHLADAWVRTLGSKAHGVYAHGRGEMELTNTHVRTEGEGAWAAVVNDNGSFSIDGGALVSEQHGGIWIRSSRDPGLSLTGGAVVSGGNGIALALDAAVAGRFDVSLDGGSVMLGDIVITPEDEDAGLVPQSEVHLALGNNSAWVGASSLVQSMALDGGSQWVLSGDSTVQSLDARNSTLALSDGSGRFNVLTVDGDLHSEGATFLFNGALAGDTSAIDRLHVRGDATGAASIAVNSIGGMGEATLDGIQLIRVDGASLADYALAGRAVGGAYEYFLFKGGRLDPNDGNWYLRSQWFDVCEDDPNAPGCVVDPGPDPDPVDPIDPIDPVDPITPPPVLRPEAGAYLANQSAAVNMFAHRLSDRMGAIAMGDTRAAWARVGRSNADFTAVGGQLSVDGNTSVLQIGTDVWRRGNAAVGVVLGSGRADNTVASDLTGYTAKGRVRGAAVGVYGTWLQQSDGSEGAYLDAQLQFGRFSNRVQGVALDREDYDSRTRSASLEGGYTFNVWQGASSSLYVQPQLQLTYTDYNANRHVESNGTVIDGAEAGGLAGRVGVRAFGQRAGMGSVVQPYVGVNWLRGNGRNAIDFRGETLRAELPRNRYEVQAGAELKISHRLGAWGGLNVQRGDHGYRDVSAQVGMRLGW